MESPISTGKKMTTERNQIHPQELIERLRLKVAALEQRIRDKDELVEEIKSQRDKFEKHLIKLTEFLEIKYKADDTKAESRNSFLLKKAAEIISAQKGAEFYEETVIKKIKGKKESTLLDVYRFLHTVNRFVSSFIQCRKNDSISRYNC